MYTKALIISFTFFLLFTAPSFAQIDNWVTVSPLLTDFIIKMPGQPEKEVKGRTTVYFYPSKEDETLVTGIAVERLPAPGIDLESYLRKYIDDYAAKAFKGKIVSTTQRDYKKDSPMKPSYRGIEAKVANEYAKCLMAAYAVNVKVYAMNYCAKNDRYSQAEAERFLDSFVLLRY